MLRRKSARTARVIATMTAMVQGTQARIESSWPVEPVAKSALSAPAESRLKRASSSVDNEGVEVSTLGDRLAWGPAGA